MPSEPDEMYRLLVENLPQGVIIYDEFGNRLTVNPAAERMLGLARPGWDHQAVTDSALHAIAEDGRPLRYEELPIVVAMSTGEAIHNSVIGVVNVSDQALHWVRYDVLPLLRPGQTSPHRYLSVFEDISQQKQAEAERAFQAGLLANVHDALAATDEKFCLTYWSSGAEQLLHWAAAEAIGRHVDDLLRIKPAIGSRREVLARLREQGFYEGELYFCRRDGEYILADVRSTVLYGPRGEFKGTLTSLRDITERREAEEALRQAYHRTSEILESIADAFYAVDAEWRIIFVNKKTEQLWRRSREHVLGQRLWSIFPNQVQAPGALAVQRAMQERTPTRFEVYSELLDIWLEASAYPTADGGLAVYFRDVTERKQAAEALRRAHAELEQRVRERTAELEQRNRELDEFVRIASHDLRTPLRGIDHLARWIEEDAAGVLPESAQTNLGKLQARVRRLDQLLSDLLAYSRAGRHRESPAWLDMSALVRDCFEILAAPPGFALVLPRPLPALLAERVPLETIFRNLLGNAVKHHDNQSAGRITVTATDRGEWVEFGVTDNGPGIEPQYHERIFQIFQTLRPRDEVEGSGLGLAVVKKLVESRGGRIWVDSALGKGATFCFTWPKDPQDGEAVAGE